MFRYIQTNESSALLFFPCSPDIHQNNGRPTVPRGQTDSKQSVLKEQFKWQANSFISRWCDSYKFLISLCISVCFTRSALIIGVWCDMPTYNCPAAKFHLFQKHWILKLAEV